MNITTPCHGKPLNISTVFVGGYLGTNEPDEIYCSAEGCLNSWAPDGIADEWNKYPEERP